MHSVSLSMDSQGEAFQPSTIRAIGIAEGKSLNVEALVLKH
ncbi:MAG: hypothetical protein WCF65_10205 [Parachlamydiaceae bacterium]